MVIPVIFILLGYAVLLAGIISNQIDPSYQSALGVAFAAILGLPCMLIGTVAAMVALRKQLSPKKTGMFSILLLLSLGYVALLVLAESGQLSTLK